MEQTLVCTLSSSLQFSQGPSLVPAVLALVVEERDRPAASHLGASHLGASHLGGQSGAAADQFAALGHL